MFHPATLLLAWAGFALALPFLPLAALAVLALLAAVPALRYARRRTRLMLRRTRWLFLSIAVLFAFSTPGLAVPGLPQIGITQDGLTLAAEHLVRLLLLLLTLALLHELLGNDGFVTGLHWLLGPVARWRGLRERVVVRLLLVVDFVEGGGAKSGWRDWLGESDAGPQRLTLTVRRARWPDWLAWLLIAGGVGALAW